MTQPNTADRTLRYWRRVVPVLGCYCCCLLLVPTSLRCVEGTTSSARRQQNPFADQVTKDANANNNGGGGGWIDDAQCTMEDLEQANDSQLHTILQELRTTTFFRNFVVDLKPTCPLQTWRTTGGSDHISSSSSQPPKDGGGQGESEEEQLEEEFQCGGGDDDEMDEDAEPLCTVDTTGPGGDQQPFLGNHDPFDSNALHQLSQSGFQSKSQHDTFSWKQHSDKVIQSPDAMGCADDDMVQNDNQKDLFWMDMCQYIHAGDGTSVINLASNPERNTGYNGTHIWNAIYEENCLTVSIDDDNGNEDFHHDISGPSSSSDPALMETCLEERVLYRLLSGLHTSTTISISKNYYPPSKKKGRKDWEPNPEYFMEQFASHPDRIRNLHFSYVVLLRALKKASPVLYDYDIRTGDIVQDETAAVLLKRLLDSAILQSCSAVFNAFDESLMFHESNKDAVSLQQNFKGVFHNISSILDCVQCQQCKLHGKMAMLGYGAALKVLFMKTPTTESLERNEVVALINTIAKFSESIKEVRDLTDMYLSGLQPFIEPYSTSATDPTTAESILSSIELVDRTVGLVASLGKKKTITFAEEKDLVQRALERDSNLLILAKHYAGDEEKFLALVDIATSTNTDKPDVIVVGSGLAGLTVSLNILDRGGTVVLIEKEHLLGGNSNKASSGINACCFDDGMDSVDAFRNDTLRSAGSSAQLELIETLVSRSAVAVDWLRTRVGVDLSLKAQLGGHSSKRTHRPSNGMAGAEIIYGIQKQVREFEKLGQLTLLIDTKVSELLTDEHGRVVGVRHQSSTDPMAPTTDLLAENVVLATGGFASDRSEGSFLGEYRPELIRMPTTAGAFSTGDGVRLATALGAGTVDMDKVQVHPTGWVDPADPDNTSKILAAELMRGVGGILINREGKRFCNELGTRAYVTDRMMAHNAQYNATGNWNVEAQLERFFLVLSSSAAEAGRKHVDLYSHKGLMRRFEGVSALAEYMGLSASIVTDTLHAYQQEAERGVDAFGKVSFQGLPHKNLETEVFYAGIVTPVLHYCMGGLTIDKMGNVLNAKGDVIPGLHAAGEVSGGVHGGNRLGGNSLLECTVYGTIVGEKLPVKPGRTLINQRTDASKPKPRPQELRNVPLSELEAHNTPEDCWVAIHGTVYDLTEFADEHPAGAQSIHDLAGKDGTLAFAAVHQKGMLDEFEEEQIGKLIAVTN